MFKSNENQAASLNVFAYNGNSVTFQSEDGVMVNATEMAAPFGKRTNDWLRLKQTVELINSLSAVTQIPVTGLVVVRQGGIGVHRKALFFKEPLLMTIYAKRDIHF